MSLCLTILSQVKASLICKAQLLCIHCQIQVTIAKINFNKHFPHFFLVRLLLFIYLIHHKIIFNVECDEHPTS